MQFTLITSRLVRPEDLNPAHRLFGGRLMAWIDECAALYVIKTLKTPQVVTLKVSEVLFKEPVFNGDILDFKAAISHVGNTSIFIQVEIQKHVLNDKAFRKVVATCDLVFVHIDEEGKPKKIVMNGESNQ